jgi:hypothetical protein
MDQSLSTSIIVDIDCAIRSVNAIKDSSRQRNRWRQEERAATALALQDHARPLWPTYYVALVRCSAGQLDDDNLRGAFKSVRDQIALWLGLDDASERITWVYGQRTAKVKNDRANSKVFYKTWAHVEIHPQPIDLALEASIARVHAPRAPPEQVEGNARYIQKPKAIPELAGGKPEVQVDLSPRPNTVASRVRVRAMRNTRDTGIGKGVLYFHSCITWEERGNRWRSQGMSVRQEELWDYIIALTGLAEHYGIERKREFGLDLSNPPAGGRKESDPEAGETDTNSDDMSKCREIPHLYPPPPPPWRPPQSMLRKPLDGRTKRA